MNTRIDAIGKACPMPVIMAKKEIEANHGNFVIIVDNGIAVQNLKKLATKMDYYIAVKEQDECFIVSFNTDKDAILTETQDFKIKIEEKSANNRSWVVFMGKETVGEGDDQLGVLLAEMFFYTLSQADEVPESILLMNAGVRLATIHKRVIDHLQILNQRGVSILVCGTCLDYYGLIEELAIGEISNMYDITEKMFAATKVVTL